MLEKLVVYIPMDRRHAISRAQELPDRTSGTALFADISGFTPLTEALVRELGPQRGAEELTGYLDLVYEAITAKVHRYGGSVIAFAGDAITCWLDGDGGLRATTCALAMQEAMAQFAAIQTPAGSVISLSMKVAVASGPVRRFVVGDPRIRRLDALAGETLVRLAETEKQARRGEVLLDAPTARNLGSALRVGEMRADGKTGAGFAVVSGVEQAAAESPWPDLAFDAMALDEIRTWLLPSVYERISRGLEEFLAELRPTAALFLRFGGIDYDEDHEAGHKLDAYIRWVQSIVAHYEGTLIDLNIGDKGSYTYINFGASLAHENDAAHAASAALALRRPPAELAYIDTVQIGVSQGHMRTGVYGGSGRRTYGALGDEVNLAARLMMRALPGQILVSRSAHHTIAGAFVLRALPRMHIKGVSAPVTVFALEHRRSSFSTPQPSGEVLPMVGRNSELADIERIAERVEQGEGQIIALAGEAGVGKTRLADEVMRRMETRRWDVYRGACESYASNSSYLVWQPIWRNLLGLDPALSNEKQIAHLSEEIQAFQPTWVQRLPLLDVVLQLPIADNRLTRSFDARLRKTALESLLVALLRAHSATRPTQHVLEDCHGLDPLNHELLQVISRTVVDRPICIVLTYRDVASARMAEFEALSHATRFHLRQFRAEEAAQLVQLKLDQLAGESTTVPEPLVQRLVDQAQGNPFYLEELTTYLFYQGLTGQNGGKATHLDLPDSLHRLVLSRLDQLSGSQKATARVASVIGRVFRADWLWGVYPTLGDPAHVQSDLEALVRQDLTVRESVEMEQTYSFKQVLTQTATYESLPFAMRRTIHNQIGGYIERTYAGQLDPYLDLLAHHYDSGENDAKRRQYLLQAGEAAQARYANRAAIDYYRRALPLLPPTEQIDVQLKLGQVMELTGQWQETKELYARVLEEAHTLGNAHAAARCETAMGELLRKQGDYPNAARWLQRAQTVFETLGDRAGVGQILHIRGTLSAQQGDYDRAQALYEESLAIRRELDDQSNIASLLSNMGILARFRDDYDTARSLYEESLAIRRVLEDAWAIANSLNNLGLIAWYQDDYTAARALLTESLSISREVGDPWSIANTLTSLGEVALGQEDHGAAMAYLSESLALNRTLGDRRAIAFVLECFAVLAAAQDQPEQALRLAGAAAGLRESIQAPLSPAEEARLQQKLAPARRVMNEPAHQAALDVGRATSLEGLLDTLIASTGAVEAISA